MIADWEEYKNDHPDWDLEDATNGTCFSIATGISIASIYNSTETFGNQIQNIIHDCPLASEIQPFVTDFRPAWRISKRTAHPHPLATQTEPEDAEAFNPAVSTSRI